MTKLPCPVCLSPAHKKLSKRSDASTYSCPRCGRFEVSGTLVPLIEENLGEHHLRDASLGHWIQEQTRLERLPLITSDIWKQHGENPHFPSIGIQVSNLLRALGDATGEPGAKALVEVTSIQFKVGSKTPAGVIGLVNHLLSLGFLEGKVLRSMNIETTSINATLTVEGWLEYENILADTTHGRTAFIAMPFNKPDLDDEWLPKLRQAVTDTGYHLERVDDAPKAGLIDTRMKLQIKEARFLLVELTHGNAGAYWEAGMAEGLGKPVIYLVRQEDRKDAVPRPHFDVEHAFRIEWKPTEMDAAIKALKATIRNTMPDALMKDPSTK